MKSISLFFVAVLCVLSVTGFTRASAEETSPTQAPTAVPESNVIASKTFFAGINLGGALETEGPGNKVLFDYGVKIGATVSHIGNVGLSLALSYDRSSQDVTDSYFGSELPFTITTNDIHLQVIFQNLADSGFYAGPTFGTIFTRGSAEKMINSGTEIFVDANSSLYYAMGALVGYEVKLSNLFSLSPEARYAHVFVQGSPPSANFVKLTVNGSFHF